MSFFRKHLWNILFVAGLFALLPFVANTPAPVLVPPLATSDVAAKAEGQEQTVSLRLDFGDGSVRVFDRVSVVTGESVFGILEKQLTALDIPLVFDPSTGAGVFIRQIGPGKNGDQGRWWQYWVNGKYAMVAADQYALAPGDTVEWKFTDEFPE